MWFKKRFMETWPNFFIVGAMKAGTTSLYEYLKNIPGIYMSTIKEPHYFSQSIISDSNHRLHPIRDKKEYLSFFENVKKEKIVGEASVSYLLDPLAPKLIHQIVPHARILISVRDPVERALSHYLPRVQARWKIGIFHQELQKEVNTKTDPYESSLGLQHGLYSENIKRYLDIFGKKQVKIIIFEELVKNTKGVLKEILGFLDLDTSLTHFKTKAHNPHRIARGSVAESILWSTKASKLSRKFLSPSSRKLIQEKLLLKKQPKPKMDPVDSKVLIEFYRDDVKKMEELLGRKLPWPNFIF